jgi:hypothetical protein
MEHWKTIAEFPRYSVSNHGRVRRNASDRVLAPSENQYGVLQVGLMRDRTQFKRSVPLLVVTAFLPQPSGLFDTPINLNGDRTDNRLGNLAWRPRWFAVKYNKQFLEPWHSPIQRPLQDTKTGSVTANSWACFQRYGLLEKDLVLSILNRTYVWPTYQEFRVIEE